MGQAIKIGGIDNNKMIGRWTEEVSASVNAESVNIANPFGTTEISIDPYCETVGSENNTETVAVIGLTVTASTITLKFDKLEKATKFKCKVFRT